MREISELINFSRAGAVSSRMAFRILYLAWCTFADSLQHKNAACMQFFV